MEQHLENIPSGNDDLRFENELLKLKLQAEFGMEEHRVSDDLDPEIENIWLNNIYAFEEQMKNAKRIKVFEALGQPAFPKADDLSDDEITYALAEVTKCMDRRGVTLDCCAEYDDRTIYRFITEELFESEMDDVCIPGMICHFIYEEFHPNHDHDLRGQTEHFLRSLLERKWDPQFSIFSLAETVKLRRKQFDRKAISSLIVDFQAGHEFEINKLDILDVSFNLKKKVGKVRANIQYCDLSKHPDDIVGGACDISFIYDEPMWRVSRFRLPGM